MGKRVKKALAGFAAAAATGDPAAIARNDAERLAFAAAQGDKKNGFFGHLLEKYSPKKLKNSIINPRVAFQDLGQTSKAGLRGSLKDKRANLRQHHALTIHPFDSAAQNTIIARQKMGSHDSNVVAEGRVLQAAVDDQTLRQDKTGAEVGLAFLGASELSGGTFLSNIETKAIEAAKSTVVKEVGAAAAAKLAKSKRSAGDAAGGLADTTRSSNGQAMATPYGYTDSSVTSTAWDDFIGWMTGQSERNEPEEDSAGLGYPWWPRKE